MATIKATKNAPKAEEKAAPSEQEIPEDDRPMTFWEHLDELRKRLVYSVIAFVAAIFVAWEVREPVLNALTKPFVDAWHEQKIKGDPNLNFAEPGAGFSANLQASILVGIALAAPVIFYQLWAFIAPGLYAREKKFVIPFVILSTLLFVGGGYFGWIAAFPIAFNYFLGFSGSLGTAGLQIQPTIMLDKYLDFVVQMLLAFGIIFELPLFILFMAIAGIVNYLQLIKFGRWFILVAVLLAGVLTPPDVTSQLIMAVPLIVLYFVSIGLAYVFGKKPTEEQRKAFWAARKKKKQPPADESNRRALCTQITTPHLTNAPLCTHVHLRTHAHGLMRVGLVSQNCHGAVELLHQHEAREPMRKRER
ncbi:MAG: twin-arginine translocase subunit TatC [Polyangiaceae bacterium]|nr:twin-arginine translocase subunit TatC [Polyangiaceae bacterium]